VKILFYHPAYSQSGCSCRLFHQLDCLSSTTIAALVAGALHATQFFCQQSVSSVVVATWFAYPVSVIMYDIPAISLLALDSVPSPSHRSKSNSVPNHVKPCPTFAICQVWHQLDSSFEDPLTHSWIWICFRLARLVAATNDCSASGRSLHDVGGLFRAIISTTDERDTPCCVVP